ncbi:hypothetical protein ETB97_012329 [Aspergillus alliaceus]|uniref:Uncharacterized protein n=1 Tax=Petromyces alliaceus TaxID=209559 RepID=A0A5N6FU02_PETAA|nr:uncharacterized protein BDW43DRAFT_311745 [Aspergillus alliaceus]KAB8232665.1 hypothetical protein BDW43DRAFT_311745 [Aspergillus alliaceus]KAF5861930.1 hypothetical protein ETB97_012329 [Aspergillus burnettii]
MHPKHLLLTLAATLVSAKEDKTTVPGWDATGISFSIPTYTGTAASVAGINAEETTYHISCTKGAPKEYCQIDKPWTLIQGKETFSMTGSYTVGTTETDRITATRHYDCKFKNYSESASCSFSVTVTGSVGGGPWSSSALLETSIPSSNVGFYDMVVTGGVDKFTKPEATKTPGAAAGKLVNARAVATGVPLAGAAAVAVAAML